MTVHSYVIIAYTSRDRSPAYIVSCPNQVGAGQRDYAYIERRGSGLASRFEATQTPPSLGGGWATRLYIYREERVWTGL